MQNVVSRMLNLTGSGHRISREQSPSGSILGLSRSLLNLAERDGRASYPQFTAARGIPTSGPRETIDPEPIVALACSPTMTTMNSRGALRGRDGAECGHERAELAMVLDAPEALSGAQQAEPDPPPAHIPIAPALDVPRDVP